MVETLKLAPVIRVDVGARSLAAVSRMRLIGSVSRGTCARAMGAKICARSGCQAPPDHDNAVRDCSDLNMTAVIESLGLDPQRVLVVGCASEAVGFYDEVNPSLIRPRRGGYPEIVPDFGAFFASDDEGVALITHMADCGFLAVELPSAYGFIHMSRLDLAAVDHLKAAVAHYDCRLADVQVKLVAAVSAENFPQHFMDVDGSRPDDRFPGWHATGLLRNKTRPLWRPTDPLDPADVWEADTRGMIRRLVLSTGITEDQLDMTGIIDPGDMRLGHASHSAGMRGKMPLGRDAYLIMPRT